jgi:hypothetical protein
MTSVTSSTGRERREAERYLSHFQAECQPLEQWEGPALTAEVCDISTSGIGLIMPWWVAPGSTMAVALQDQRREPPSPHVVEVKYAHIRNDARWAIGGAFIRHISPEALQALL